MVPLVPEAKDVLRKVQQTNLRQGLSNEEGYLFLNAKGRIHDGSLDSKIRTYCKRIGIPKKSMHKIRKTFISRLIDSGINLNTVREIAGHEDEEVTLKSYCFDRHGEDVVYQKFEDAFSSEDKAM